MKIAYIGRVSLSRLEAACVGTLGGVIDTALPKVRWGFPLGSEIVLGLLKRGHEVHVITEHIVSDYECYALDFASQSFLSTNFTNYTNCLSQNSLNSRNLRTTNNNPQPRLYIHLVPSRKRSRWTFLTLFSKEVRGMRKVIEEIKPDVCFAQWTYYNAYAALTSGYPTLVVAHDSPWRVFRMFRNLQTLIKAVYATMFVVPKIKHLTAVSPHIVEEFRKFGCLEVERFGDITVIPNGVEVSRVDREIGRENSRGEHKEHKDFKGDRPTVVCISQAGRLKNSKTLFEAWKIVEKKHPDWRLLVYGQGMDERSLEVWRFGGLELRGIASREELDRVLREEADLFVSPTLEESFGMVFVEAMKQGVPCIGGEKSGAVSWVLGCENNGRVERVERVENGHKEHKEHKDCGGVVCDVTEPEKLAECIEMVMRDLELRKKLGEGGIRRVKEMFDIERVVDLYEQELKKLSNSCNP